MVKFDTSLPNSDLAFSKKLAALMLKHAQECVDSRAVWVFVGLLESDRTRALVFDELKKHKKFIQDQLKASPNAAGLKVLVKLLKL